eukprot:4333772-Amphidinium_carterae.1
MQMLLSWEHRHDFSLRPFEVCNAVPVNIEQKDVKSTDRRGVGCSESRRMMGSSREPNAIRR